MLSRVFALLLLAVPAAAQPSRIAILKFLEDFKDYANNPQKTNVLLAEDAELCHGGDCQQLLPFLETMFKDVKTFDYHYDIIANSKTQGVVKCYAYLQAKGECYSLFSTTMVFNYNNDNKIQRMDLVMDDAEHASMLKCVQIPDAEL